MEQYDGNPIKYALVPEKFCEQGGVKAPVVKINAVAGPSMDLQGDLALSCHLAPQHQGMCIKYVLIGFCMGAPQQLFIGCLGILPRGDLEVQTSIVGNGRLERDGVLGADLLGQPLTERLLKLFKAQRRWKQFVSEALDPKDAAPAFFRDAGIKKVDFIREKRFAAERGTRLNAVHGDICMFEAGLTNLSPEKVVHLGLAHVPEGRRIFPSLTVYENLLMGTLGNKKLTKAQITELVDTQFALFPRLSERRSQVGGSLSGGEQQMLAVARGLMMNPQMVMLDEPSLGLAPIIVEEIFELILKIRAMGKTVLLIEQNASMALSIADRGYVIANGRVLLSGTGDDLLNNEDVKKAYLGV